MLLKRFYDDGLAQASYMVGAETTGEALVIDPLRDIEPYLAPARDEDLRITHVTETHIHADFLSGARDLVRQTGARLLLSAEGDPDWQYRIDAKESAELLRDGDTFSIGEVRIEARHMPGHTPEHLVFFVTDTAVADRPVGVFTGDFIFAGDVGRPHLLERAANATGTMETAARTLFGSLRKMREFPEYLQLWPGHGAGSACGKALGSMPSTTLGYERLFNWAFQATDEDEFVHAVLAGQPEPPRYFGRMKLLNRDGPPPQPTLSPRQFDAAAIATALDERRATIVDTRSSASFAAAFIPGTINIPPGGMPANQVWLFLQAGTAGIVGDPPGVIGGIYTVTRVGTPVTQWFFAEFLLTPYARNFLFGVDQWDYSSRVGPWRYRFWRIDTNPVTPRSLLLAALVAVVSARVGLWWGNWMARLRR